MKDLAYFTKKFAEQFDETDLSLITPETQFREIDEWNSLLALSIIAMVDEEFNIRISGEDIKNSSSIKDIYETMISKLLR